jgi:hypothetical protein
MSIIKNYLSPLVEKDFSLKGIWERFKIVFPIMWHGIIPHKNAQNPPNDLPDLNISVTDESVLFSTAMEIYKEANDRIEKLEEKAFKLLTYISALSALILYFLSKINSPASRIFVIISVLLLFIAILLSLRCLGTKTRKSLFIDSIYNFENSKPVQKDKNQLIKFFLDCAIYNQTVADNTADILKASRYFLTFAFIVAFIGVFLNISKIDFTDSKLKETVVIFKDSTIVSDMKSNFLDIKQQLDSLTTIEIEKLSRLDSINKHMDKPKNNNIPHKKTEKKVSS